MVEETQIANAQSFKLCRLESCCNLKEERLHHAAGDETTAPNRASLSFCSTFYIYKFFLRLSTSEYFPSTMTSGKLQLKVPEAGFHCCQCRCTMRSSWAFCRISGWCRRIDQRQSAFRGAQLCHTCCFGTMSLVPVASMWWLNGVTTCHCQCCFFHLLRMFLGNHLYNPLVLCSSNFVPSQNVARSSMFPSSLCQVSPASLAVVSLAKVLHGEETQRTVSFLHVCPM